MTLFFGLLAGCSASPPAQNPASPPSEELRRLEAENVELARRLAELEAERDTLRAEADRDSEDSSETDEDADDRAEEAGKSLPVLKLSPANARQDEGPRGPRPVLQAEGTLPGMVAHLDEGEAGDGAEAEEEEPFRVVGDAIPHLYDQAISAFDGGQFALATALCTEFMSRYPDHPYVDNALYLRAKAQISRGDERAAQKDLEALVAHYPRENKAPEALFTLAGLHAARGEDEIAMKLYQALWSEHPDSAVADQIPRRYLP